MGNLDEYPGNYADEKSYILYTLGMFIGEMRLYIVLYTVLYTKRLYTVLFYFYNILEMTKL